MSDMWRSLRYGDETTPYRTAREEARDRFRSRSSQQTSGEQSKSIPTQSMPVEPKVVRTEDGDRPYAYPAQKYEDGPMTWRPPVLKEILVDLGLRMLEGALRGAATEIVYFFVRRRFVPPSHTPYQEDHRRPPTR